MSLSEIEYAISLHTKNDLEGAARIYRVILNRDPNNVDANNLLANVYASIGKMELSLYHSNIACSLTNSPDVRNNRGRLLIMIGKYTEALSDLNFAIKQNSLFAEAENNICICYRSLGDLKKSILHGRKSIEINPDLKDAYINLGLSYFENNEFKNALECFQAAGNEKLAGFRQYISYCLYKLENFGDSVSESSTSLELMPGNLDLLFILMDSCTRIGNMDLACDALVNYNKLNTLFPVEFESYLKQDIFFKAFQDTLRFISNSAGGRDVVIQIYKKLLSVANETKHALLVNLGVLYFEMGDLLNARSCNEDAIKYNYDQKWAHNNLGVISIAEMKSGEAIFHFQNALKVAPDFISPITWLLKEKMELCDWANVQELKDFLVKAVENGEDVQISGISLLANFDDNAFKLKCMQLNAKSKFLPDGYIVTENKTMRSDGKIRIGYYSFDFRDHPVAHLTNRLFKLHDRSRFEVYCYSYGPDDDSEIRRSIIQNADVFRDLQHKSIHSIADDICQDQIDILIDLTGDTKGNRSEVFKYRIAKVKAHWLGFIGTLGTSAYDYLIADLYTIPYADERFYTEKILRIDDCFHVCDDSRDSTVHRTTREQIGLPKDAFIFAVCSQTFKIQPEVFKAWLDILENTEGTIIALSEGPAGSTENLKAVAHNRGLSERLFILPRVHVGAYLARYELFDMVLDTFPYTSGTVASDALFGACPILTMYGNGMSSRMCASILTAAGFPELIAYSLEEYVEKAVFYAKNLHKINEIKSGLQMRSKDGKLLNTQRFVKNFEKALSDALDCVLIS